MVRVEMLAVGKELLIGRTLNTNAYWLGKRLARMGSMLKEVDTVDDDLGEIGAAFTASVSRSPDFLIVVGGLGPTPDDMTLKGVAKALGVRLKKNKEALTLMREHYAKMGLIGVELTPARLKMATLPSGAHPLRNEVGTAPGVMIIAGKTKVFCLPGVPLEMRSIFRRSIEPEVREKLGKLHRKYITMKLTGVPESALVPALKDELERHPEVYIKSHPRGVKEGVPSIELDIAVAGEDSGLVESEGEGIAKEMLDIIVRAGGKVVSSRGLRGGI